MHGSCIVRTVLSFVKRRSGRRPRRYDESSKGCCGAIRYPSMASKTTTNNLKAVLVVDDDAELCALIGEVLKATSEFHVEAVHDGRRGLALALEPRFDLVHSGC